MRVPVSEKLQKVLARAGLGSRRAMERWIEAGRISVNGRIVALGERVTDSDAIRISGQLLHRGRTRPSRRSKVLLYHKPTGEICTTSDPEDRPVVFNSLPHLRNGRWISVGRLDLTTSGALLFTDDGELANRLMHPSHQIEREYAVRVLGEVSADTLATLCRGVMMEDGEARFDSLRDAGGTGANHWYHVTLHRGRTHEVRRLWESQGVTVSRLIRVRYGPITLPRWLRPGHWKELDRSTVNTLLDAVGLAPSTPTHHGNPSPSPRRARHADSHASSRRRH